MRAGLRIAVFFLLVASLATTLPAASAAEPNCDAPIACTNLDDPCSEGDSTCWVEKANGFFPDSDRDEVVDCESNDAPLDNCVCHPNPAQADSDGDGVGDACDTGDDEDGTAEITSKTVSPSSVTGTGRVTYTLKVTGTQSPIAVEDFFRGDGTITGTAGATAEYVAGSERFSGDGSVSGTADTQYTITGLDGGTATIQYQADLTASSEPDQVFNGARIEGTNDLFQAAVLVQPRDGDGGAATLDSKTVSADSVSGTERVTYTLKVTGTQSPITVKDSFSGSGIVGGTNGATADYVEGSDRFSGAGDVQGSARTQYTITDLGGGTATIRYDADVSAGSQAGEVTNTARIDGTSQTRSATVSAAPRDDGDGEPGEAAFTIVKGVSDRLPRDGERVTYSLRIKNVGGGPGDVTVTDTIGANYGELQGDNGGTVRFTGNENVVATVDGRRFAPDQTGSLATPNGATFLDIPAGAVVTTSFQARVDSSELDEGVESRVTNTAELSSGQQDSARLFLTGPDAPRRFDATQDRAPRFTSIPNQVLTCGESFADLDVDDFVVDDNITNSYTVSVSGNRRLQASITPSNVLQVTDPIQLGTLTESLTLTLVDDQGRRDSERVTYRVLESIRDTPVLAGIPDQIIESDEGFNSFRLRDYVQGGDTGELTFTALGSELLDVVVRNDTTVEVGFEEELFEDDSELAQISEKIEFGVVGCRESRDVATFTIVNEDLDDLRSGGFYAPAPSRRDKTCAVKIGDRLVDDTDCDGVVDPEDNCPLASNPSQSDADNNGRGDACDLAVFCEPQQSNLAGGRTAVVDVTVANNMDSPVQALRVSAGVPELGAQDRRTLSTLSPGETDVVSLRVRLPACSQPGRYRVVCEARSPSVSTSEVSWVSVGESEVCVPSEGKSGAEFYQVQDVVAGSERGAVFPVTISNDDGVRRTYMLSAEGVLPWGDYVFESGSVVVVEPGKRLNTQLRVFAPPGTEPGEYPFRVTVESGADQREVVLAANVVPKSNVPRSSLSGTDVVWVVAVALILGIVVLAAVLTKRPWTKK